jgi:hypothetical protein
MAINALTGNEYTGTNDELLNSMGLSSDHKVATFNQCMKLGIKPATFKGTKKLATLKFCKEVEDSNGKKVVEVKFFNVFDYEMLEQRQLQLATV